MTVQLIRKIRDRQPNVAVPVTSKFSSAWLIYSAFYPPGRITSDSPAFLPYIGYFPTTFGNAKNGIRLHAASSGGGPSLTISSPGKSLLFASSNSYLLSSSRVGDDGVSRDETMVLVIEFDSTGGDQVVAGYFSSYYASTDYGRGIVLEGGTIKAVGVNSNDGKVIDSGISPIVGKTYVIGARFSASGGLFINGVKVGAGDLSKNWGYIFSIGATGGLSEGYTHGARNFSGKLSLMYAEDCARSDADLCSLTANPWQIFEPETIPLFFSTVTAQYARPTSDVASGTWTASTGSDLFAMLDETAANDADYITTTSASTCEVALGSLSDPASSTGHIVRYRISSTGGGITVRLRQGTTTIASWTHSPAPTSLTTYEQTLSGAEADSITSYAALKLQFEAY